MKKNKFLLFALFLIVFSACSDDYVERDFTNAVSEEQLAAIANSSPEAALSIAAGVEGGNNFFLNDFNTAGNGNIHDDFGHMAVNLGTDLMSNDMVQVLSHWFFGYIFIRNITLEQIRFINRTNKTSDVDYWNLRNFIFTHSFNCVRNQFFCTNNY